MKIDNKEELRAISEVLDYDLVTEIIWSAIHAIKDNPKLSIEEAIQYGKDEWIK